VIYVTKEFSFSAAHRLPNYDGKCQRLHGHTWRLVVTVGSKKLIQSGPHQGMAVDFNELAALVNSFIVERLDHHDLNDTMGDNPTAEILAQNIYHVLKNLIEERYERRLFLYAVEIWESPTSKVIYTPDPVLFPYCEE